MKRSPLLNRRSTDGLAELPPSGSIRASEGNHRLPHHHAWFYAGLLAGFIAILAGCRSSGGPVSETSEYSFDQIAAELAAEESASEQARQE